jgi:hypothetical protein
MKKFKVSIMGLTDSWETSFRLQVVFLPYKPWLESLSMREAI